MPVHAVKKQGERTLFRGENLEQIVFIPSGEFLFRLDPAWVRRLTAQEVQSGMTQDREIFGGMIPAYPAHIFVEAHIQDMKLVFDAPVETHGT